MFTVIPGITIFTLRVHEDLLHNTFIKAGTAYRSVPFFDKHVPVGQSYSSPIPFETYTLQENYHEKKK